MDANLLLECFSATLQSDHSVRHQAELQLRQLVLTPGFLGGCLDIISSNNPAVSLPIKKAAAVFFKNRVVKYWGSEKQNKIDNDEKPGIRDRILPVLIESDYNTKQQLIPVLRVLISYDFPNNWKDLLETTGALLQQVPVGATKDEDFSQLYTGLLCFSEISRKFRWVSNSDRERELDAIIVQVFPHLLNIGNSIIANSENMTELTAEILKLILKVYKFVTYFDLPVVLQTRESLIAWGEFHGSIVNMNTPTYVLSSTLSEQEKSFLQISKCYKWAVANLYRIFTRYASKSLSKKFAYTDFQKMFCDDFIPHLITNFLSIIEQWCSKKRWLSLSCIYYLLQFLSHCVTQKPTWVLIKPYFENLVSHLIYPLLCPSDHVLEIFETDPHEYIHSNFDIYDEFDTPDVAALGLLVTFVDKRKKTTLEPIIKFVYNQLTDLQQQPETLEVAKKREGALRLMGGISHYVVIPHSPYYSQMEQFLTALVFPNLSSKFDFLKARTLEVSLKFADLNFENKDNLSVLFHGILNNFSTSNEESSLPVDFECALVIQAYIHLPEFQEALSTIILPTMSKLLDLSNQIDNDAISAVMQECVENFSEQLQPFGVDLMAKLVEQFMRLAVDINEASKVDVDEFDGEYEDQTDKIMAAVGLLNTMITVLLSFENSREICAKLEEVFSPVIEFVLINKIDDFLTEVGELMENSTFLSRSISPIMWKNFTYLYQSFTDGIALMYTEELSQCLQNFLIYGQEDLMKSPQLVENFYNIFNIIIESEDAQVGFNDIVLACELAQTFILMLQTQAQAYIPNLVNSVLKISQSMQQDEQHVKSSSFNITIQNVIIAAMVHDSNATLMNLQNHHQLVPFFVEWFKTISILKRVYDLKLSTLGLISLMDNNEALNLLGNDIVAQIGSKLASIMKTLPKAIENLEHKRKNFSESEFTSDQPYDDAWENHNDYDDDDDDVTGAQDLTHEPEASTTEYLDFLQQENVKLKNSGFFDEEDLELIEDPLAASPLDSLNVFQIFKQFSQRLHANDNAKYSIIFGSLDVSDQKIFTDIFEVVN